MRATATILFLIIFLSTYSGILEASEPPQWICGSSLFYDAQMEIFKEGNTKLSSSSPRRSARLAPPTVGTPKKFWVMDLNIMPPPWIQIDTTCRAVGTHCYVFVQDSEWGTKVNLTQVNTVMNNFDLTTPAGPKGIYETCTETFGPAPDMFDSDPKIYILIFDIGVWMGSTFDGYFSAFDEMTDADAVALPPPTGPAHSNEVEMIYIDCNPTDPADPVTLGVIAHEFQHMLHWNADPNEAQWVNEGCAEYAMHLCGYPTDHLEDAFAANPDANLTLWDAPYHNDYGASKLFAIYISEHFGGKDTISTWVAEPKNGIAGLNSSLSTEGYGETFRDIFPDWVIANYLDVSGIYGDKYYYAMLDFPSLVHSASHSGGILPTPADVNKWGADYIRFTTSPVPMRIFFNGQFDGEYFVNCIAIQTGAPSKTTVTPFMLDTDKDGGVDIPGFGTKFDKLVLAVATTNDAHTDPVPEEIGPCVQQFLPF